MRVESDFLVIGGGIAGLSFALKAANHGQVHLIVKTNLTEGATAWAQGGIAAAVSPKDSPSAHLSDTLTAGAGLCDEPIVDLTVKEGPSRVEELIALGVPFTKAQGTDYPYDLTQEGGHHARRILHANDFTGKAVIETLTELVKKHPNITLFENHVAIDLMIQESSPEKLQTPLPQGGLSQGALQHPRSQHFSSALPGQQKICMGAYCLDTSGKESHQHGPIESFVAKNTILATGGAGKVYLYTTNPDVATGDGIAMAYRAGARIANLEFMQFHPTCLYHEEAKSFLISEALRGEGGELITPQGEAFMNRYHPMGSLAPRDIVARAIDVEMKRHGWDCVYLDMTRVAKARGTNFLQERFPNISEYCSSLGIDITKDPIPVVPAAHYMCGGIYTNQYAQTTLGHLYAIGEVACTGLHGSNRLASNSLLEGLVFAHRALEHILEERERAPQMNAKNRHPFPEWNTGLAVPMEERIDIKHLWKEIRTLMWNYVGIVRSEKRLRKAQARLQSIQIEINEAYWTYLLSRDLIELRNIGTLAQLIVECALSRKESRGLHYNLDYPQPDDLLYRRDTIL